MPILTTLTILLSVALNALAQVLLRHGMSAAGDSPPLVWWSLASWWGKVASPGVLGGFACYAVSIVLWLLVLSRVQVSIAYPFQALGYVFASLVAWRFLGEGITWTNGIGLALICAGVLVLSRAGS